MSLNLLEIVVTLVTMLFGSTVFSTVGFGIGVSTAPVLLLILDPQTVVVMLNTVSLGLFALIIYQTREHLRVRETIPVSIAGLIGVPIGVFILSSVNASALRISISAIILVLAILAAFSIRDPLPMSRFIGPVVGLIVAVLLTALGIGGALLALFVLTRGWNRHAVRGSLAFYFLLVEGTGVIGYGVAGLFTMDRIILTALAVLPVLAGFGLATIIHRRMNETIFRRAALTAIVVTSLIVLGREVAQI